MQLISKRFWPYEMVMVKEVSMLDPNLWRAVMNNDKNWPVAATGFLRRVDAAGGERSHQPAAETPGSGRALQLADPIERE